MIFIDHSTVHFLGREMEAYGFLAVLGAVLTILGITYLAHRRKLDASFAFRCALLTIFSSAAFHIFFQYKVSAEALLFYYPMGFVIVPLVFWLLSRIFRQNGKEFFRLGLLASFSYSVTSRFSCLFGGCCYGPPWGGFPALVYGPATHNPLPGVPLFPLQPVAALVFLIILGFAVWVFLKGGSGILLAGASTLNLAVYYTGILITPATTGGKTAIMAAVITLYIAALGLFVYNFRKRGNFHE